MEPRRIGEILNYPILVVRYITDPLVDFVLLGIKDVILTIAEPYLSERITSKFSHLLSTAAPHSSGEAIELPKSYGFSKMFAPLLQTFNNSSAFSYLQVLALNVQVKVQQHFLKAYTKFAAFAYGDSASDRALAVLLGYGVVLCLAAGYIYLTSAGQLESAARVIRRVLKQQLIVVKV